MNILNKIKALLKTGYTDKPLINPQNRLIIVPKDLVAMEALDYDKADDEQLIIMPLNEKEFNLLFYNRVFNLINDLGEIIIDDFEDDQVTDKAKLIKIEQALISVKNKQKGKQIETILEKLINLFSEAIQRNTGVYFYF